MVDDPFAKANVQLPPAEDDNSFSYFFKTAYNYFFGNANKGSLQYPRKNNRYFKYGWNNGHQFCYTEQENHLLKLINEKFLVIADSSESKEKFTMKEDVKWSGWWRCYTPEHDYSRETFTLANREAKDSANYPLWGFSYTLAKQIANQQSERSKNQDPQLINDPPMLVFEELKNWLLTHLSEKQCKKETLEYIAKRQNYIRNIIHLTPNFGPDRFYLHELETKLNTAKTIILNCIANKQLPELLSDIIVKAKSLEETIGTYLHFLLVNEEVSENFSDEFIKGTAKNCYASPICKVYKATANQPSLQSQELPLSNINHFYNLQKISEDQNTLHLSLDLKTDVLNKVNFANFITEETKVKYLESVALLDSLIKIRETLERYKLLQASLGTYGFAISFLTETQNLAKNYMAVIDQAKSKISDLIQASDDGLKTILRYPEISKNYQHFEKNIRALDVQFAKETTLTTQLENYSLKTKESMNVYQEEMQKLVSAIQSGKAMQDINRSMHFLIQEINRINTFLPAQLSNQQIKINKEFSIVESQSSAEHDYEVDMIECASKEKFESCMVKSGNENNAINNLLYDSGKWDRLPKLDPSSNEYIYTFRVYKGNQEVGTAKFLLHPYICYTANQKNHNVINLTGVLENKMITPEMSLGEICENLPPTLIDKIYFTAKNSATQGFLRGSSNILAASLRATGVNSNVAYALSKLTYYSCIFAMNFYQYLNYINIEDVLEKSWHAALSAGVTTGKIFLLSEFYHCIVQLIEKLGDGLTKHSWVNLGPKVKKLSGIASFGLFALSSESTTEAAVSLAAGTACQLLTEKTGTAAINYLSRRNS